MKLDSRFECVSSPARSEDVIGPFRAPAVTPQFLCDTIRARKIEEETLRKEEEKRLREVNHPAKQSSKRAKIPFFK